VWVNAEDVRRLAAHRGTTPEAFAALYVRNVAGRLSLKERANGDCVMLEGKRCSVYAVKPTPCSTYPFWPENLDRRSSWDEVAAKCPGANRGDLYTRAEVDAIASGVAQPLLDRQEAAKRNGGARAEPVPDAPEAAWRAALADLEDLYAELDRELPRHAFTCQASGDCCDFDAFGHRLYATTLEAEWFFRKSGPARANEDARLCPAWGSDRLCKARTGRMLGCRTFHCGTGRGDPREVHERYHRKVREIHERHGIPLRYADVVSWAAERRPAAPR
jgi:hypothetical protein